MLPPIASLNRSGQSLGVSRRSHPFLTTAWRASDLAQSKALGHFPTEFPISWPQFGQTAVIGESDVVRLCPDHTVDGPVTRARAVGNDATKPAVFVVTHATVG